MLSRGPYETGTREGGPKTLGDRLRVLRIQSQRTQARIAEDMHTDQAQISAWERDRVRPSKAILAALAAYYRIKLDMLETGEGFLAFLETSPAASAPHAHSPFPGPHPGPGKILALDQVSAESSSVEIMEAMQILVESHREGRKVWIVVE